jgi:transposase
MVTQLSAAQLQFARHCFLYNESTDFYLHRLSTAEIADTIQCSKPTVLRLRKIWKKTGDVERIYRRPGRPPIMEHVLEQAVVQMFIDHVDIMITEALE